MPVSSSWPAPGRAGRASLAAALARRGGLVSAANGDVQGAIFQLGNGLGFLLLGPAALHDLRRATAPDGSLAQLRAATARVAAGPCRLEPAD